MTKQSYLEVSCTDIGPGCGAMFRVATEEEFWEVGRIHARLAHGLQEVPPELAEQVRKATRSVEVDVREG